MNLIRWQPVNGVNKEFDGDFVLYEDYRHMYDDMLELAAPFFMSLEECEKIVGNPREEGTTCFYSVEGLCVSRFYFYSEDDSQLQAVRLAVFCKQSQERMSANTKGKQDE